jgi:hypothetical protein
LKNLASLSTKLSESFINSGFDEDVDARIARRGAHGHVKMGKTATANDNAVALAA